MTETCSPNSPPSQSAAKPLRKSKRSSDRDGWSLDGFDTRWANVRPAGSDGTVARFGDATVSDRTPGPRDYRSFLASKRLTAPSTGFPDVTPDSLNPLLFDWQRAIVAWALRRGRAGIFPDTGLGKTAMQLVIADEVCRRTGMNALILAPLAVGRQTMMEASKFAITTPVRVTSSQDFVQPGTITITNYEKLHRFDPAAFACVALDEGSILKSYDGKTRDQLIEAFQATPYRFVFTATPSPNDIMEVGSYCEFLGIMSRSEMLATFFTHDGGDTSKWRLKRHAEQRFFEWMASWAVMLRTPSDIGYSDDGYILPELRIHEHIVETGKIPAGYLFQVEAKTLADQRQARRDTIDERADLLAELANADPAEPWVAWCNLNDESTAAKQRVQGAVEVRGSQKDYEKEQALIDFTDGTKRAIVTKPEIAGFGLNWQHCSKMAFLGLSHSYEQFYQAIRRIYRFGQQRPCDVHVIVSDRDGAVIQNIQRKQAEAERLVTGMVAAMGDLTRAEIGAAVNERIEYRAEEKIVLPEWL